MFLENVDMFICKTGLYKHLGSFIIQYLHVFKKYGCVYSQNWIIQAFRQFL
jgi:hypothetical protein